MIVVTFLVMHEIVLQYFHRQEIDLEALRILNICYQRAKEVLAFCKKKHLSYSFKILS